MSDDRAFERVMDDWLADGSDRTPASTVDAVLLAIKTTPQERDLGIPWRTNPMSNRFRLAAVTVVAVIAVGVLALNLPRPGGVGGSGSSPSPSPLASPSPSAAAATVVDTAAFLGDFALPLQVTLPAGWTLRHGDVTGQVQLLDLGATPGDSSTWWGPDIEIVDGGWVRDPANVSTSAPDRGPAARIPFPADFFGYLAGLDGLTVVQEAAPVTIGGVQGSRIVVKTPAFHPLIWLAGDFAWLGVDSDGTTTTSYTLLVVQGKSLLIVETEGDAVFADREAQVQAILQTIVFGS